MDCQSADLLSVPAPNDLKVNCGAGILIGPDQPPGPKGVRSLFADVVELGPYFKLFGSLPQVTQPADGGPVELFLFNTPLTLPVSPTGTDVTNHLAINDNIAINGTNPSPTSGEYVAATLGLNTIIAAIDNETIFSLRVGSAGGDSAVVALRGLGVVPGKPLGKPYAAYEPLPVRVPQLYIQPNSIWLMIPGVWHCVSGAIEIESWTPFIANACLTNIVRGKNPIECGDLLFGIQTGSGNLAGNARWSPQFNVLAGQTVKLRIRETSNPALSPS